MPLKQCTNKEGVKGFSWGNGGCIVGKDAKKKSLKQGMKIEGIKKFSQIMKSESSALEGLTGADFLDIINDEELQLTEAEMSQVLSSFGCDLVTRANLIYTARLSKTPIK